MTRSNILPGEVYMARGSLQNDVYIDRRGRKYKRMTHEQRVILLKNYMSNLPRWRRPIVGYIISLPLTILTAYGLHALMKVTGWNFSSASSFMVLPVLFLALFWGVGPALFAILVGILALDYWFVDPLYLIETDIGGTLIKLLPFIVSGLIIAVITAQREQARLNSLSAEWELQAYARHLEEVNQKLEDANRVKDRFMSIASHELKTPITTIRGQAQLMLRRLSKQKELSSELSDIQNSLMKINEQTGRLTSLIDDLLDMSSIRSGKIELRKKKCDLCALCAGVVEDLRMMTGRTITLECPETPINANVDADRFSQVVVNLVNNAVKYSPEGKPVEVSIAQQDKMALLQVRDRGKGIAKDQQERIFDTFYRTPDAESSSKRGLGLGLAISKEIVERHGGRIWVESTPGKGSTFFVEVPLR
jgi:signal transduction histidine kinase